MVRSAAKLSEVVDFGGMEFSGSIAEWLRSEQRKCNGQFRPTPIQTTGMGPVFSRQSVALMAPTGTGKTLAYLLPLWKKLDERLAHGTSLGPRLLIIAPSLELQMQVAGVLRSLVGTCAEQHVLLLERASLPSQEQLDASSVVIATPSQAYAVKDSPLEGLWATLARSVRTVVMDEADLLLPPGGAMDWTFGSLLESIIRARQSLGKSLQLVAASASIDVPTLQLLSTAIGDKIDLIRSTALDSPEFQAQAVKDFGTTELLRMKGSDSLWPMGLSHHLARWDPPLIDPRTGKFKLSTAQYVRQVTASLSVQRCLLIIAEKFRASERGQSVGKFINSLRPLFTEIGYQVTSLSAAVQAQIGYGHTSLTGVPSQQSSAPQVIIGRSEALRGLDLFDIHAVVIVGQVTGAKEYLHLAGRTGRCRPGQQRVVGGKVVSIGGKGLVYGMKRWRQALDFKLEPFTMKPLPAAVVDVQSRPSRTRRVPRRLPPEQGGRPRAASPDDLLSRADRHADELMEQGADELMGRRPAGRTALADRPDGSQVLVDRWGDDVPEQSGNEQGLDGDAIRRKKRMMRIKVPAKFRIQKRA